MTDPSESQILVGYNQFLCAESLAAGDRFSLSLFEDLNRLVESVVLYDQIVLLGAYSLPSGILATPLREAGILKTMTDADVRSAIADEGAQDRFLSSMVDVFGSEVLDLEEAQPDQLIERRIPPNAFDQSCIELYVNQTIECGRHDGLFERERFKAWIAQNVFSQRERGGHFYYFARAILYGTVAERSGMDYAPDLLRLPIAALGFSKGTKTIPRALYDALVDKIHSEVAALAVLGMPLAVFIPPLTAKLLARVNSPDDYPGEVLALREKFAGFRSSYREFVAIVRDPNVTLKNKIDAKRRMLSRITGVLDKGESGHALNVKTILSKLFSSSVDDSGVSAKLSLSGLMSLLCDQMATERVKGQARALFDLWTDTLNLRDYGGLIEKTFGTTIDSAELELYKGYTESVRRLIRGADESA